MTRTSKFPNLPDLSYRQLASGWYLVVETIQVSTGVRGRRAESGLVSLDVMGLLTIREGFEFDGASGPAIDTTSIMYAACIHDALYSLMEVGSLPLSARQSADLEFLWLIRIYAAHKRTSGIWAFLIYWLRIVRSMWCYAAVRMFGGIWLRPGKGRGARIVKRLSMGALYIGG